jgi:GNAT superfamily N-acetyltransferase
MSELNIYQASVEDAALLASIHIPSKIAAETGIVSDEHLASLTIESYEQKWKSWLEEASFDVFIVEAEGAPAGFITCGKLRTPPPGSSHIRPVYSAEIMAIYVHPDFWEQGCGRALMQAAARHLKEKKHGGICLWALDKNKKACGFYEKLGGQRCGKQMIETGGRTVKEVCYGWRDVSALL